MLKSKIIYRLFFVCVLFFGTKQLAAQTKTVRNVISFDKDWRFMNADTANAQLQNFDDSQWRKLDVPHDWSIEGDYAKTNPTGRGGGYLPSGVGWYRKTFVLNDSYKGKKISIYFEGVMANSQVWINGHLLGKRPYGYISFSYDLTPYLHLEKGAKNIIAVKADNSLQPASRYYTGAGIYRHVKLIATNPIHIVQWGSYVRTTKVNAANATLIVSTQLVNQAAKSQKVDIKMELISPEGKIVKTIVPVSQNVTFGGLTYNQEISLPKPQLWDIDAPQLYKLVTTISSNNKPVDQQTVTFGIREAKFEAATGFWLNGKNIKIKGVCLHHDAGALGSAVPMAAWERRFKLLKEVGVNAIRVGHNPMAPEFLDLCDSMGFMVMNETFDTWTASKNNGENGYNLYFKEWWEKDIRDLVRRDRNHPSIIVYSVGNEIRDNLDSPEGFKKYKDMQDIIHELSPGIPVTMALFRPNSSLVYTNGFAQTMDIVGQNYRETELVDFHEAHPETKALGTENGQTLATWLILRDKPYMAGQFLWTGFNYLGEANWPQIANNQGLFDHSGRWTVDGLQRQSWWSEKPVVHLVRREENAGQGDWVNNWTPTDLDTYDIANVQVFSNCDEVEVFLNGKSQGIKSKPANDAPRAWAINFDEGTIKAVGRNKGKEAAVEEFTTAGEPYKIVLETDKSTVEDNWDDVVYVTAKVVDKNGILCPNGSQMVTFDISENGKLVAVDNGNIISHEKYKANNRLTYKGSCQAIISAKAAKGIISLKATSPELKEATTTITIK